MPETRASGWPLETPDVENPATFPEVADRDVEHPTRVLVSPIATSPAPFVADLGDEGGDGEAGTPIDAALFAGVRTYVDAGDKAARDEAVESAQTNAQTLDGILDAKLRAYADDKATEEATAKADAARSAAEAHADEAARSLQGQIDSIVETGTAAMQASTVEAIVDGTPAEEVEDKGFAERVAVGAIWQAVEAAIAEARKSVYPVGSYLWTSSPEDPATALGFGEWERVEGRFLWACEGGEEAGTTGGARTVALEVAQMPAHSHTVNSHTHTGPSHTHTLKGFRNSARESGGMTLGIVAKDGSGTGSSFGGRVMVDTPSLNDATNTSKGTPTTVASGTGNTGTASPGTTSVGGGAAHENMPPYLAAYCWHRTA